MTHKMRNVTEVMRDEMVMRDRIRDFLQDGPKTIPEIAEAIGYPDQETVYWVMAMRRYGLLEEEGRPDDDGYFQYKLTSGDET